jgi:hypothetical protein
LRSSRHHIVLVDRTSSQFFLSSSRLRQVDVKAEHFERQVQRLEQERDAWEKKYEVCLPWSPFLCMLLMSSPLQLAGGTGKASQGADRSGRAGSKHAGSVIGSSQTMQILLISCIYHFPYVSRPPASASWAFSHFALDSHPITLYYFSSIHAVQHDNEFDGSRFDS